jgi:hypothetical protein
VAITRSRRRRSRPRESSDHRLTGEPDEVVVVAAPAEKGDVLEDAVAVFDPGCEGSTARTGSPTLVDHSGLKFSPKNSENLRSTTPFFEIVCLHGPTVYTR